MIVAKTAVSIHPNDMRSWHDSVCISTSSSRLDKDEHEDMDGDDIKDDGVDNEP